MLIVPAQSTSARRATAPDARLRRLLEKSSHPDAQTVAPTPALAREGLAALTYPLCTPGVPTMRVHDDVLAGTSSPIPIRLYDPAPARELPVCLYLHGGGHMAGSIAVYDPICRRLAATADCRVVAVEYRLAPEHPYPQGLHDCAQALAQLPAWLAEHGLSLPGGLTVAGDSGGGALTASLSAMAHARDDFPIARQVLIYPGLDYTLSQASVRENGSGYLLDAARTRWYFDQYFQNGEDRAAASPLTMPATQLPPTLLFTAGFCLLRDEGYAYAERLHRLGTPCTHWQLPGMIHAFLNMHALVPDACEAVYREMGRFMRGGQDIDRMTP